MDGARLIQAAVARADLALCTAWLYLRAALPALLAGGLLRRIIKREEKRE